MNQSLLNSQIDSLNLNWQEYDFGDTFYAKIPASILLENTDWVSNLSTTKYQVEFHRDGYGWIFKDHNQGAFIEKFSNFWQNLDLWFVKNNFTG